MPAAERTSDWRPGEVILDLYEVLGKTKGGMGVVYRVRHQDWGIDLAVKVPRAALLRHSPESVRNFETEAETWAGLGVHPHIVNCAYVRRIEDSPGVFAEWADGGSVAEAVRSGRLYADDPLGSVLDAAIQSAWGLAFAHAQGLVHQDVKPANLMLAADGTVKVTDFGLARARWSAGEPPGGAADLAVSLGGLTAAYCSPEQAAAAASGPRDGAVPTLTAATDVWSWAVTVVELFLGRRPSEYGQDAGAAFADLRRGGTDGPAPLPGQVADLLAECLRADPAERPIDLGALAERLIALHAELLGRPYPRRLPAQARLLADGLSNRALSMLDLGRPDQSELLWERALEVDPRHPHTMYNRGLHRWRHGRATDAELVQELTGIAWSDQDDWVGRYLLGLVYRERGDVAGVPELFESAALAAPGEAAVAAALAEARAATPTAEPVELEGHDSDVVSVAVSADGAIGASLDEGGVLRVWDLDTGARRTAIPVTENGGATVALAPDGSFAVVVDGIGYPTVWNLSTPTSAPAAPLRLGSRLERTLDVVVTPDGLRIVTLGTDGRVSAWDPATGSLQDTWEAPDAVRDARPVAVDPTGAWRADLHDGARLTLSAIADPAIADPAPSQVLDGWNADLTFASAGGTALTVADDGTVRVFFQVGDAAGPGEGDGAGGPWRLAGELRGAHWPVRPSGDGRFAFGGGVWWDLAGRRCLYTGADRDRLVALDRSGTVALAALGNSVTAHYRPDTSFVAPWSYTRPRDSTALSTESDSASLALDRSARLAAVGQLREAARVVRAARDLPGLRRDPRLTERWRALGARARRPRLEDAWPVRELRAPSGQDWQLGIAPASRLAMAHSPRYRTPWIVDRSAPRTSGPLRYHTGPVTASAISADGAVAVSGAADARVIVWDAASGSVRHLVEAHKSPPLVVAVDRRAAMTGSGAGEVGIIDVAGGGLRGLRDAHAGPVRTLVIAPGGEIGLSSAEDGSVCSWDLRSGALLHVLRLEGGWAHRAALSSTGHRAVLWITDDELRLWSPRNGATLAVLSEPDDGRPTRTTVEFPYVTMSRSGRAEMVNLDWQAGGVAVSADGRWALTADRARGPRIWDLDSGQCTKTLQKEPDGVTALAVTPDFGLAAIAGIDGVDLWDLTTGTLLRSVDVGLGSVHPGPGTVKDLALAPDGGAMVVSDSGGRLREWALDWELELPDQGEPLDVGSQVDAVPVETGTDPQAGGATDLRLGDEEEHLGTPWLRLLDTVLARRALRRQVERTLVHATDPEVGSDWSSDAAAIARAVALLDQRDSGVTVEERAQFAEFQGRLRDELAALAETARSAERAGRHAEAEPLWRLALGIRSNLDGAGAPDTRTAVADLAACWSALGRADEAAALLGAATVAPPPVDDGPADPAALEADVQRMTARLRALRAESTRLLEDQGLRAAMGPAETALAVARIGDAQDRFGASNLALALTILGDLCRAAELPFAAVRYLAEALVVSARAKLDVPLVIPLDKVAGLVVAAASTIDLPYGAWFRSGDTAAVREAIDPAERGLLRELMHWCDEAGRVFSEGEASNWASFCHSASMVVGEVMREDDPSFTAPLCETLLTIADLRCAVGDPAGGGHLLRRAIGLAYNGCLEDEGDVARHRTLVATLNSSVPVLEQLGETARARAAEEAAAYVGAELAETAYARRVPDEAVDRILDLVEAEGRRA
ncbi:protein kinase domain-containing protein [Promicromonospora sp. NFX87]|uniref:protein kinase domain-containing protein n=1 Tax=Promicromonospora sp. NFX87 TaxID=3402691 RepID=UPI003AFB3969